MALTTNTTTLTGETIVTDATLGGVAIDYTGYYERIATALETIAVNSTSIKNSLAAIADNQATIADDQATIADKITSIENRASNDGIKITGPYEWLSMSSLLRLYDEQGIDITQLKQDFLNRVPREF